MINNFFSRQFLTFILTGGTAATVNLISRLIYNQWLSFSTSVVLAYLTGMITAFILAKIFVFRESTQSIKTSALFFILVNVVAGFQTWVISMGLVLYGLPALGVYLYADEIAHGIGVIVPVFTSYIGHKYWSFR